MAKDTTNLNLDEHNEPQAGASQMPVGVVILLILAGYIGCYTVDKNNANFSAMVHAPFTEPDEVASLAPSETELMRSQGRTLYANCQGCHQANGMGTAGQFPPLAGSEWVRGNPETVAAIVLQGLSGPLKVAGKSFGAEAMTPFGPALKDEEIAAVIRTVPGAADLNVEATSGLPQMTVEYNRAKMAQYGVTVDKLNDYVSASFAGEQASVIFEGEKRFDVVIRLAKEFRQDINSLKNLYIDLPNGAQVPLKEVADISYKPGPMQISRDNTSRRISVGVNVRGRDVKSMVEEIQQKLETDVKLPPGYFVTYGGSFENLQRASDRLMIVVPIALFLIFILLYFALSSFSQSVMIYMAVPLAAIGGVFALWIRGMPFSISAGVGFIVLFGVAVLNGLVLINKFNELKESGMTDLKKRIYEATHERLRPILLTATAAIMGFIPMALSTSGGAEVQRPLATVVIGGLLTATFLTLVVLPVLYYWLEARKQRKDNGNDPSYINKSTTVLVVLFIVFYALMSVSFLPLALTVVKDKQKVFGVGIFFAGLRPRECPLLRQPRRTNLQSWQPGCTTPLQPREQTPTLGRSRRRRTFSRSVPDNSGNYPLA